MDDEGLDRLYTDIYLLLSNKINDSKLFDMYKELLD